MEEVTFECNEATTYVRWSTGEIVDRDDEDSIRCITIRHGGHTVSVFMELLTEWVISVTEIPKSWSVKRDSTSKLRMRVPLDATISQERPLRTPACASTIYATPLEEQEDGILLPCCGVWLNPHEAEQFGRQLVDAATRFPKLDKQKGENDG